MSLQPCRHQMVCEEGQEEGEEADREAMPRRISAQARLLVGRAGKAGIRDQPAHGYSAFGISFAKVEPSSSTAKPASIAAAFKAV